MNPKYSILIVDDDPFVLESISLLLKEYGYSTVTCDNARCALDKLKSIKIDAVLTDIVMPVVSGIELLEEIHKIDYEMPVILMTAYADMDKAIEAIKKGAFDFIIKPYKTDQLVHSTEKAASYYRLIQKEKEYKNTLQELNQELETLMAERTMSLMALTVADRVRNPAAVIGLTCRRILEKEEVPDKLKGGLKDIIDEAEKLERIVKDFETILKSRQFMFMYEDINGIVEDVTSFIGREATDKGLRFEVNLSEEALKINAQRNLLRIAILHIIRNAIEATPEGGKITVTTYGDTDNVFLTISDTGVGIPKEDLDRIFDPFFSSKVRRFGMGLPLAKQIVSEHLGEIRVESEPGKGTTFAMVFPVRWIERNRSL